MCTTRIDMDEDFIEEDCYARLTSPWENRRHQCIRTPELVYHSGLTNLVACQRLVCPVVSWLVHSHLLDRSVHLSPALVCVRPRARICACPHRTNVWIDGETHHAVHLRRGCRYGGGHETSRRRISGRSSWPNCKLFAGHLRLPPRLATAGNRYPHRSRFGLPGRGKFLAGRLQPDPGFSTGRWASSAL